MSRKAFTRATDFHHFHSTSLGLIVAMYSLGSFVAVPFSPLVVDKIGRRYPILLGGVISIVGGILQGLHPIVSDRRLRKFDDPFHFESIVAMFVVARFLLEFANVFCVVAASSLIGGEAR